MGKKRIVKTADGAEGETKSQVSSVSKKKVDSGILFVESTFNNTKLVSLPSSFGSFKSLEVLILTNCPIQALP